MEGREEGGREGEREGGRGEGGRVGLLLSLMSCSSLKTLASCIDVKSNPLIN